DLKARAKENQEEAAQEVGRQFEAMFVQMVFKSMREANAPLKSDLMGSSAVDTFEQMYHEELSQVMSQKGVFGLGDWLAHQVTGKANAEKAMQAYNQTRDTARALPKEKPAVSMPLPGTVIREIKGQTYD
ncbi:MAG: rod-binding protein, partial [Porticoccaceae bacterium]